MKKLVTIIVTLLVMLGSVQAETRLTGTINQVSLEGGYIVINQNQYKIKRGKTEVYSGDNLINEDFLKEGQSVYFSYDNALVTKIRLITQVELRN